MRRGSDGKPDLGDKKMLWKLDEQGNPKMVIVKPGLSDGTATEMVEGDLKPGDQLITEVTGVSTSSSSRRRVSAF
jgi:multidrug efflux pump subunit AcrA (membrane-fusion protein)